MLLQVDLLGIDFLWHFGPLESGRPTTLLLLDLRCHVQNFINNLEQVVRAPLLIISHDIFENAVHLENNIHLHELCQFDLPRLDYGTDDLDGKCVELWMVYLKVLEDNIDQLQFAQDHDKGTVSLYHH